MSSSEEGQVTTDAKAENIAAVAAAIAARAQGSADIDDCSRANNRHTDSWRSDHHDHWHKKQKIGPCQNFLGCCHGFSIYWCL